DDVADEEIPKTNMLLRVHQIVCAVGVPKKLPEGAPNYVCPWSTELWCSTFFPKGRLHRTAAEGGRWLRADGDGQTNRCCYCCCRRRADGDGWMQPDVDVGAVTNRWRANERRCCCCRDR
ncbi:hypothetical protein ACLOJK_019291, partial [Asimina triloba]